MWCTIQRGYKLYLRDRDSFHGIVCIYVREDVKSIEVLNLGEDKRGLEQVSCGISKDSDKVLVGCMYRPPASDSRVLKELLKSIQRAKERVD